MNREELFGSIAAARLDRGDVLLLERRGDCYARRTVPTVDDPRPHHH